MNPFISSDGRLRNGWRFLIACGVFIISEILANKIASTFFHTYGMAFEAVFRPTQLVLLLIAFSLMVKFLDRNPGNPLAAQGLGIQTPWRREIAIGLLIGFGLVAFSVIAIALLGDLSFRLELTKRTAVVGIVILFMLAAAAMLEEVIFRGYPFQRLADALGGVDRFMHMPFGTSAIFVLSILFGAGHLKNPHATLLGTANTVLIGVLFAIVYLRTRSLWMPFGIHLGWNATLGMIFGLPVSGITAFSVIVHGNATGPGWLTGGDYGLEASVTGTLVILLGILLVVKLVPSRAAAGASPFLDGVPMPAAFASNNKDTL